MTGTALPSDTEGPFIPPRFTERQLWPRHWASPGATEEDSQPHLGSHSLSDLRGYMDLAFFLDKPRFPLLYSPYGFSQFLGSFSETICNYFYYLRVRSWVVLPDSILKLKLQVSRDLVCFVH